MKQPILGLTIVLFLLCSGTCAAEYSDGKHGKALNLDGSSHTVKIPHYAGIKPNKAITVSAWIKPERVGKGGWQWQEIYRKEDGNARVLMAIGELEKKHSLCFGLGIGGKYVEQGAALEPEKLLDGKWHLVSVTFDGKAIRFYADGQEIGVKTATGSIDTQGEAPAYIGSDRGTREFFKGGIDDVRVYNRALSTGEIKTMAQADGKATVDGIVGWWKLDGDLKNSATKAPTESVAQFRGVDRKWKATPFNLSGARLDIRPAGEAAVRVTIRPIDSKQEFPYTPALIGREYPEPVITLRKLDSNFKPRKEKVGPLTVEVTAKPLTVLVTTLDNKPVQKITFASDGKMSFALDGHPVLGLGEGGPKQGDTWKSDQVEFDRRGRDHVLQPRYDTKAYGSRNPVALLVGTGGWGLFVATPWGDIDLTSKETGTFTPAVPIEPGTVVSRRQQRQGRIGLPPPGWKTDAYDVFVFDAHQPAKFMKDVSTISGPAVLPPRWAMGYMQSHRTLEDDAQMVSILDTFREKQMPVDAVIYLGTGFTPRGWNTNQPSFEFNRGVFKREPKEVLSDLRARHAKVVVHMIPWDRDRLETLHGFIPPKSGETVDSHHIDSYWKEHNALVDTGVDAWWPDEGDWFSFHERMKRHQLYYEGPLSKTPNVRPWSLHRNGHLGVARYGGWIWSGDTHASFKTLEAQIAVGINHSLSLSPFWGSDIGGFYPTPDLTGELYARWFQFAAFTSSFRGHGRTWQMRLPWGWGLDKMGPKESNTPPLESELNNPKIEPIAKKYAELRYQLLSYNYTLAWEARTTGMPMMRSMWLHHPTDPKVRSIGDQYLWGRDLLIAPVYKKSATTRNVYLPAGKWYDWWTGKLQTGGGSVQRAVDLATMPIYVRAGAIVPIDPIRQYTGQKVDEPTTLKIYRGTNGNYTLYDDDGISLSYLKGDSVQTLIKWDDAAKTLSIEPASKQAATRAFQVELIPDGGTKKIQYTGQRLELKF
ncbi:MAG: glycoside hydrolase family 31 protein [Roseibacillus sp.]|nr:glycoside hydrolase family 31 protein [Roseibacillus sp.]